MWILRCLAPSSLRNFRIHLEEEERREGREVKKGDERVKGRVEDNREEARRMESRRHSN